MKAKAPGRKIFREGKYPGKENIPRRKIFREGNIPGREIFRGGKYSGKENCCRTICLVALNLEKEPGSMTHN